MEREEMERLIIDYIDGRLDGALTVLVEDELSRNEDARKLYLELKEVMGAIDNAASEEAPARLRAGFDRMLREQMSPSGRSFVIFRPAFYRVAAAVALMVIGGAIGFWISRSGDSSTRMAAIEKEMEMTRKQLQETKSLMMGMLGNELSASQRMKGVNVALEVPKPDDEIVNALLKTMMTDGSTNVRLAALDALARFRSEPQVRNALVKALSTQTDPMVQIGLIHLMVDMKETEVLNDLRKIVDDDRTMKAVRDEAYTGILKLS